MGAQAFVDRVRANRRVWIVGSLIFALVAAGAIVAAIRPSTDGAGEVDCSQTVADTAVDAQAIAGACDVEVEVLAERTPWVTVSAMPSGESRMTVNAVASRVLADGEWTPLDTDVVAPESGSEPAPESAEAQMLSVAASAFPMEFNPGGEAGRGLPLGTVLQDEKWVKIWFPFDLPVPVIDGRFVSYELDDGVRLVVAVGSDGSGFRPIVELDSPAAAAWFRDALDAVRVRDGLPGAGYEIPYRVEASEGLQVRGVDGVGFEVVNADEQVVFWSPPSTMWDSAADDGAEKRLVDRLEYALPGDRSATMPVRVEQVPAAGQVVVISPSEALLTGAETVWPVRIDPTLGGRTPVEWVAIRTGGYTTPIYKWTDTTARNGESMGRCNLSWAAACNTNFTSRLVWEFAGDVGTWMNTLVASNIISASFTADPGGRGSCVSTTTDAYLTVQITETQRTWSTIPFTEYQSAVAGPQGDACSDAGARRGWNVKNAIQRAADANWPAIGFGLKANNEVSSDGYKTYRADARLDIVYNRPPAKSTTVKLSVPAKSCASGTARPSISTTTPTLSAAITDPDGGNVQAQFQIVAQGTTTEVWNSTTLAAKASGSTFTATVAAGKLVNGKSYQYRVNATDGTAWSGWSTAVCEFAVDTVKPPVPTITPVQTGVAAIYEEDHERGGVGVAGKFTFSGSPGTMTAFKYSFNSTTATSTIAPDANGAATISYSPTTPGLTTLRVWAVDAAGNTAIAEPYVFSVGAPQEDGIWMFDEADDQDAADTSGVSKPMPLAIVGAGRDQGPHAEFGSRDGDRALVLDGDEDHATAGPVLRTDRSFVVSAYVMIDSAKLGTGTFSAVSQDGIRQSGFEVSYLPTCTGMTGGCLAFSMPNSDVNAAAATTVTSAVPVVGDRWFHVLVASDVAKKQMSLSVCAIGTPTAPESGTPVTKTVARTATPWNATGAFEVGRGLKDGAPVNWWPGRIDNVRVFSGEIVSDAKIRRICNGAEARDFTTGLDALDPTTTIGE